MDSACIGVSDPVDAPALAGVLARYRRSHSDTAQAKRKPGRPLKRTADYFESLLASHRAVVAWFVAAHGCEARSDRQLYTDYFAHQFHLHGERASRATAPEFQRALKTLRNELAEARRMTRPNPENSVISGTR